MEINETKQLMNALSRLCGKDNIYELEHRPERNEEDELLEVMSKPVSIQMWSRFHAREKNYATSSYDINKRRYKGRDEDALETYRLEGLRKIAEETDPLKKLDIFYECARELQDSIKMLDFLEYVSSETRTLVSIDACSNMFDAGKYTLKIIDKGLNVDEETQSAARFEDSLKFYFKFYICRITDVVSKGYDWDVVCEMLREDKTFTDLIKPLVDNGIMQVRKTANDQKVEL